MPKQPRKNTPKAVARLLQKTLKRRAGKDELDLDLIKRAMRQTLSKLGKNLR